jgi:hypothetical protein
LNNPILRIPTALLRQEISACYQMTAIRAPASAHGCDLARTIAGALKNVGTRFHPGIAKPDPETGRERSMEVAENRYFCFCTGPSIVPFDAGRQVSII